MFQLANSKGYQTYGGPFTGTCLDISTNPLGRQTCSSSNVNQLFSWMYGDSSSTWGLIAVNGQPAGYCLDDGGATTSGSTNMVLAPCSVVSSTQLFQKLARNNAYDTFRIQSFKKPNLCVNVNAQGALQLWTCDNSLYPNEDFYELQLSTKAGGATSRSSLFSDSTVELLGINYGTSRNSLKKGENLRSPSGLFTLSAQSDGNLVVYEISTGYKTNAGVLWQSKTNGQSLDQLLMQNDGNLVAYPDGYGPISGHAIWSSGSRGKGTAPYRASLQDDGKLVIYDTNNNLLWSSVAFSSLPYRGPTVFFQMASTGNGMNPDSGMCLDAGVGASSCSQSHANQAWAWVYGDYTLTWGLISFVGQGGVGLCLDDGGATTSSGANFRLAQCSWNSVRQMFKKVFACSYCTNFQIQSMNKAGLCVDLNMGGAAHLWSCYFTYNNQVLYEMQVPSALGPALFSNTADNKMFKGDTIYSSNGLFKFSLQTDGNLVLYDISQVVMWSSGTNSAVTGKAVDNLKMQPDGNLVLYSDAQCTIALWSSQTSNKGTGPYRFIVKDNGNLAVYDANNNALWLGSYRFTGPFVAPSSMYPSGKNMLYVYDTLYSPSGNYYLTLQSDGNVVIYDSTGVVKWSTGTTSQKAVGFILGDNGNLRAFNTWSNVVWSSNTPQGTGPYRLTMQDDGHLVVYDSTNSAKWST